MNTKHILSAQNVTKTFSMQKNISLAVLKGVTASFEQGTSYAITGVSGTGKSTLLHLLAGLDAPTDGAIVFDGKSIAHFSAYEREQFLAHSVGLVFQQPYLVKELSVIENVMLKGRVQGIKQEECREQAHALLKKVNVEDKINAHPSSLSGGQQQRVALARALFGKPAFLLADEPTGNLDEQTGNVIVDLLADCQSEWGMGLIISSHDAYVAQSMDHIFVMNNGLLVAKE